MGKSVMVVDDSRVVHTEMKKLLADTDFEIVGCCRSGEEAIAFYGEHKPDLVTMDIIMPGMDGLAAARAIIGNWPDARIIMVSSPQNRISGWISVSSVMFLAAARLRCSSVMISASSLRFRISG